jgi:hypothetical protein
MTAEHEPARDATYRTREHDHLVEPLFGGLSAREPARAPDRERVALAIAAALVLAAVAVRAGIVFGG